jgi:hypothetical protein
MELSRRSSLLEVVLGPALEADLAEGERDEQAQVPCHQPQPATTISCVKSLSVTITQARCRACRNRGVAVSEREVVRVV